MSQTLSKRLGQARNELQKRRWIALFLRGGFATISVLLAAALLNRIEPIRESTAFGILAIAVAGFLVWLLWASIRMWQHPPSLPHLADEIEKKQPEWMDALICAVELEEKPNEKLRPLERSLVSRVQKESLSTDFQILLIPSPWRKRMLAAAAIALALIATLLFTSSFFQKGRYFLVDLLHGESTGLIVAPGDTEAPVRTDVEISATVSRWENIAEIEYIDQSGHHQFPMHPGSDGHRFTFYDIGLESIRYRISTPSLQTEWFEIVSFVPPEIEETEIRIAPPAYTGLEEQQLNELTDFPVVEGSEISWMLTAPTASGGFLQTESANYPLQSESGRHAITLTAENHLVGRFVIEAPAETGDSESTGTVRSARTREFRVQVQPDLHPTIEITQPGRDIQAEPSASVPLQAIAADDFGLSQILLHVSVSGMRQPPVELLANPDQRMTEQAIRTSLNIESLEVTEGDVVVYFLTATDNREPEAQQTRSEVFFIEIREEVEPEEMEGDPLEVEQVNLQALILELKRLIRLSWQATGSDDLPLEREIATGLEEARLETVSLQQEFINQLGEEAAQPVVQLMNRALQRMESAGRMVDQRLLEDSLPYQEMALADIVAIQTALEKNQTTSREPSEGSSGEGPTPPETAQEDSLEDLQRLMREVERLSDAQAAQNSALRRAQPNGLSPQQQTEYRERQEEIRQTTENILNELADLPGTEGARREMAAASFSMEDVAERISGNEPASAARAGDRARSALLAAAESLENALGQASGNQIAQLAQMAEQLAQQQGASAAASRALGSSESPSTEEAAALRRQQETLQQQLEQLLASVDGAATQLRSENPAAAAAMAEAAQQIRDQNILAEMGRAGNALLYRRYERAAEMQENVAENLGQFAGNLAESTSMLPPMDANQLRQLLAQVQQHQQELMQMMGQSPDEIRERLQQIASQTSEQLGQAGEALQNQTLNQISGELGGTAQEDQAPNLFRMNDLLRAAARSLEQQVFALEIDRRARLQRQVAEPPERYRGLVEEYFKELSEEP